jgi:hypothetical protein
MKHEWQKKFKEDYSDYGKELVSFVEWYLKQITKDHPKELVSSTKPYLVNFGHCLLVFLNQCDGKMKNLNKVKIVRKNKIIKEK